MRSHEIKTRIRYAETDQMGVVYHGNYAQFFEVGRVEWLRALGVSYKSLEESGIMLPVRELNINYLKPAKYDDLLTITTGENWKGPQLVYSLEGCFKFNPHFPLV